MSYQFDDMKTTSAVLLAFTLCATSASLRAAGPAPADGSLKMPAGKRGVSVGIETASSGFHPMIAPHHPVNTCVIDFSANRADDLVAVYRTNSRSVGNGVPLAHYRISGLPSRATASPVAITLKLEDGRLAVSAKAAGRSGKALTVSRVEVAEAAKATSRTARATAKPAAIAEGPGKKRGKSEPLMAYSRRSSRSESPAAAGMGAEAADAADLAPIAEGPGSSASPKSVFPRSPTTNHFY